MNQLARRLLSKGPIEKIEQFTPAEAKRLILTAPNTNRIRPATLAWWMKAIESDEVPASPPLRIDYNDQLKDGWHRLLAVVFTGRNASLPVLRG